MPNENERIASGPGLIARRFGLNSSHDNYAISIENGLWISQRSFIINTDQITNTTRIGISKAKDLRWRWYLNTSRSVSKRAKGDLIPKAPNAWRPTTNNAL